MCRFILVVLIATLALSAAEERTCVEIDGGMECASRSGNSASYTKSITRTGEAAVLKPLPPLPPLKPLFPPIEPLKPLEFPPIKPIKPLKFHNIFDKQCQEKGD